jgi:subtilase family serine protease
VKTCRLIAVLRGIVAFALVAIPLATFAAPSVHRHLSPQFVIGPRAQPLGSVKPGESLFTCQVGLSAATCYDAAQMRTAYGVGAFVGSGVDGSGRTIVIIDSFQSPTLTADVDAFSANNGLSPSAAFLTQIAPDGLTPFDPNDDDMNGWSGEITLDVEWAHAIAPGAKVVLVLAKSDDDDDLLSALNYAIKHNLGDVISMSFGGNESCLDASSLNGWHNAFATATLRGITLFASSGDQGAAQPTCDGNSWTLAVSHPASDPLVSGVGGTELHAAMYCLASLGCDPTTQPAPGTWQGEIVWNEFDSESTGGGISVVFPAPLFQKGSVKGTKMRTVPDVAYNAAIEHGVLTYWQGGWWLFGGTSAGSPQWAAIVAITDQYAGHRLGFLNAAFYRLLQPKAAYAASFHDIVDGDNSVIEEDVNDNDVEVDGYVAGLAWDATTGIGSPRSDTLVGRLIHAVLPADALLAVVTSIPRGHGHWHGARQPH